MPRTIEGVELARTGTYRTLLGERTFTRGHLASAVTAAGSGASPRIRLGHVGPRFDGEPAVGSVRNLRLSEDGDLLVGDLADVPDWLADAMPASYPGRSIEGLIEGDTMRLTGLALLGVTAPGIDSLADLQVAVAASGWSATFASGQDAAGHELSVALPSSPQRAPGAPRLTEAPAAQAERVVVPMGDTAAGDALVAAARSLEQVRAAGLLYEQPSVATPDPAAAPAAASAPVGVPAAVAAAAPRPVPSYESVEPGDPRAVPMYNELGNFTGYDYDPSPRKGLYRLDGHLRYFGEAVELNELGEPCVRTRAGRQTIASFEATGGDPDDLVGAADDPLTPAERAQLERRRAGGAR